MIYLIDPLNYEFHRNDLKSIYRLRHKVFFEKLNWQVESKNGLETDQYDEKNTYYILYKDKEGVVRGCLRLVEMTNLCMFDGPFQFALPDLKYFKRSGYWEGSRLAIDFNYNDTFTKHEAFKIARLLFAAVMYFGLHIKKVEYYLCIGYPSIVKTYSTYPLLCSVISTNQVNNEEIVTFGFPPLAYSYDKILEKINYNPKKPIIECGNQ